MTLHNNNNNIASSNGKWYNTMVRPYIGNATSSVAQREHPYYTSRLSGAYRPEQNGVQPSGHTISSSGPVNTSSVPNERTTTTATFAETPDDDDDDEEDDDYDYDSGFCEEMSEDDSDSTMDEDTPDSSVDSGEEANDGDKTTAIPSATNAQHEDLANITQQLNSAKTLLIEVNNRMSKAEEELDRLDDDLEAVHESFPPRDISDRQLETYSKIERRALDDRKQHAKRIYGEGLDPNFQEALDHAAAKFAEEWVDIIARHGDSRDRDQRINYINWQKALKEVEIEADCKRSLRSIEKDIEDLRQKAKAIKIIGRVHELGVEGIKALIATGNETLEYTFGISSKDEECTCCN